VNIHTPIHERVFGTVLGYAQSTEELCKWQRWCIGSLGADAILGGRRHSAGHGSRTVKRVYV